MSQSSSSAYLGSQDDEFERALLDVDLDALVVDPSTSSCQQQQSLSHHPHQPSNPFDAPIGGYERPPESKTLHLAKRQRMEPSSSSTLSSTKPSSPLPPTPSDHEPTIVQIGSSRPPSSLAPRGLKRQLTQAEKDEEYAKTAFSASKFGDVGNYLQHKRMKLQLQNQEIASTSSGAPPIFAGLAIYVNGYVEPSLQELREMFLKHGGMYHAYLDKKSLVTHIVATNLTPAKIKEFKHRKVVFPSWITESIAAGKLLPWASFRWTPQVVAGSQSQIIAQPSVFASRKPPLKPPVLVEKEKEDEERSTGKGNEREQVGEKTGRLEVSEDGGRCEAEDRPSGGKEKGLSRGRKVGEAEGTVMAPPPQTTHPSGKRRHPSPIQPSLPLPVTVAAPPTVEPSPFKVPALPSHKARPSPPPRPNAEAGPSKPKPFRSSTADRNVQTGYARHASNVNAQALMADDSWRRAHTSANPGFLEGYYKNSRLHHLSNWKAELKLLVSKFNKAEPTSLAQSFPALPLQQASSSSSALTSDLSFSTSHLPKSPLRATSSSGLKGKGREGERIILHCDFDAFFVSVGLVKRPDLKGKPCVVCHSEKGGDLSTSEIASPSYEARAHGVKAGMSLRQARALCEGVEAMPYDFTAYKEASLKFYTILSTYADVLQAVSVDEALVDVTSRVAKLPNDGTDRAKTLAEKIRDDVRAATQCEISIGISQNILLARIASRKAKPAGSFHLTANETLPLLAELDVNDLWGIGNKTREKIKEAFGTTNVGDIRKKRRSELQHVLKIKPGNTLYDAVRGIDKKRVEDEEERQSVSADINYGIRFESAYEAEAFLRVQLAPYVADRLKEIGRFGRSMTLKVMQRRPGAPAEPSKFLGHGDCITLNQTSGLQSNGRATSDADIIAEAAISALRKLKIPAQELRGIGIMVYKLEDGQGRPSDEKREAGQGSIRDAFANLAKARPPPLPPASRVPTDTNSSKPSASEQSRLPNEPTVSRPINLVPRPRPPSPSRLPSPGPSKTTVASTPIPRRPRLSQVDPDALAALPSSLRRELYPELDLPPPTLPEPTAESVPSPPLLRSPSPLPPSPKRPQDSPPPVFDGEERALDLPLSGEAAVTPPIDEAPNPLIVDGSTSSEVRLKSRPPRTPTKPEAVKHIVRQLRPQQKVQVSPNNRSTHLFTNTNAVAGPSRARSEGLPADSLPPPPPPPVYAPKGSQGEIVELAELLGWDLDFILSLPPRDREETLKAGREQRAVQDRLTRKGNILASQAPRFYDKQTKLSPVRRQGSLGALSPVRLQQVERAVVNSPSKRKRPIDEDEEEEIVALQNDAVPYSPSAAAVLALAADREGPIAYVYPSAPLLSKSRPSPSLPELRQKISTWLSSELQAGPSSSGVIKMGAFLESCARTKAMGTREIAVGGLRWWRRKLRDTFGMEAEVRAKARKMRSMAVKEFWEEDEDEEDEEPGGGSEKKWFDAFEGVKAKVDGVFRERHGRGLKL